MVCHISLPRASTYSPKQVLYIDYNVVFIREFANGNTFGAIAFSSYGGLWLSFAIILTPGGFNIVEILSEEGPDQFYDSFGFYLLVSFALQYRFY